ncbi:unnamed protein product, partial [Didymodactylos carnosus]
VYLRTIFISLLYTIIMENNSTNQSIFTQNELSSTIKPENKKEFNCEDFIIIWLDHCHTNITTDHTEICRDLCGIINNLKLFNDADIDDNDDKTYIEYVKGQNIFNDKQLLINKISEDVKLFSKQLSAPMTFFNNIDDNIKEKSVKALSKESQYFICQDFDTIYKFRYIIKDLHDQLNRLYLKQKSELTKISTVYRGQLTNENELKNLQQTQGELISMNSFLSTTLNKMVALDFILSADDEEETVPVLLEININNTNSISAPYAYIEKYTHTIPV